MREIIQHKWMRVNGDDVEFDRLIANSIGPSDNDDQVLNEMVLQHMETLGIGRDQTVEVRIRSGFNGRTLNQGCQF